MSDKLPNMVIVGAQKCGTTYTHRALTHSKYFFGTDPKEAAFFNRPNQNFQQYCRLFAAAGDTPIRFESTPGYFQIQQYGINIAKSMRDTLGDIPLLLLLRHPVDRYLSAYCHHIVMRRLSPCKVVAAVNSNHLMVDLGFYDRILEHFREYFSDIRISLFDDLQKDSGAFIHSIIRGFGFEPDVPAGKLKFKANTSVGNARVARVKPLPQLAPVVRRELTDLYQPSLERLQTLISPDISHWLE